MARLSKYNTIAPQRVLLPPEIDRALQTTFGRPYTVRTAQPFGVGFAHAFDSDGATYRVPEQIGLDPVTARVTEEAVQVLMEWAALAGPTREAAARLKGYDPDAHRAIPEEFARAQEEHRGKLLEGDWHKGDKGRRVSFANAFTNYQAPLEEALNRAGLHWGLIYELGDPGMSDLIRGIPIADVDTHLQRFRHEASQRAWEPNDLNDLDSLARAIVYCDIVVTEKQWVSVAARAGLGEKYGTQLLSKPEDVVVALAGL
jgi:hypothetical protein